MFNINMNKSKIILFASILTVTNALYHAKSYLINNEITGDVFAFDQTYVYVSSEADVVQRSLKTGDVVRTLRGHSSTVESVILVNDTLVSASTDGIIIQWDLISGSMIKSLDAKCVLQRNYWFQGNVLVSCVKTPSRMIDFGTGVTIAIFEPGQIFFSFNDVFYAFTTGTGVFSYQRNLAKSFVCDSVASALTRNDDSIFLADSVTFRLFEINIYTNSVVYFSGTAHQGMVYGLDVVDENLISGGNDGLMIHWNITSHSRVKLLKCNIGRNYIIKAVNYVSVLFSDNLLGLGLCNFMTNINMKVFAREQKLLTSLRINGDFLYSGSIEVALKQWSITSRQQVATLANDTLSTNIFFFNEYLLSCSDFIRVTSIVTGKIVKEFAIAEVDGRVGFYYLEGYVYAVGLNGSIKKYNVTNSALELLFADHRVTYISGLFAYNSYLYSRTMYNIAAVWDLNTGMFLCSLPSSYAAPFTVYGSKLAMGVKSNVFVINLVSFDEELLFSSDKSADFFALIYDESSGIIFGSGQPPIIYGWDTRNGFSEVFQFSGHSTLVRNLVLVGDYLFSCSEDGTVKQWSLVTNRIVYTYEYKSKAVTSLNIVGDELFFGMQNGDIFQFQVTTAFLLDFNQQHKKAIVDMVIGESYIFVASSDSSISVLNFSVSAVNQFRTNSIPSSLAFSERFLYTSHIDQNILKWNYSSGVILGTYVGHNAIINDLIVNGNNMFSAGSDFVICLWDVDSGLVVVKYKGHNDQVTSISILQNNLISASLDKSIIIWDIFTGNEIRVLKKTIYVAGHLGPINQIKVCDGNLFSASSDLTIKQWDPFSGNVLYTFFGHTKSVTSLTCSNQLLFSGSEDSAVFLWFPVFHSFASSDTNYFVSSSRHSLYTSQQDYTISNDNSIYIIVAVLFALLIGILLFLFWFRKRFTIKSSSVHVSMPSTETALMNKYDATLITQTLGMAIPGFLEMNVASFRFLHQIARGGGGSIFLAEIFGKTDNFVAKMMSNSYNTMKPLAKLAFDQEITLMEFLKPHRNIAKIVGFCKEPSCIIMKYYINGSLNDLIYSQEPLEITMSLRFLREIAEGISFMHLKQVSHGDLKPDNVLLDHDEQGHFLVLTDFGIAQILSNAYVASQQFQVANLRGLSVHYAGPEVFTRFNEKDNAVPSNHLKAGDVYSFGIICWEILVRKKPWSVRN